MRMFRPILITAGATRNPIDAMRFISAFSTGATGAWLAEKLTTERDVQVFGSPEALMRCGEGFRKQAFTSTDDLMQKVQDWVTNQPNGVLVHAAAVGDYAIAPQPGKIQSGQPELVLKLRPTPKILDAVRGWSDTVQIVSFKAAPPGTTSSELERLAQAQGERSDSALVFANVIGELESNVLIWSREESMWFDHRTDALAALAERIVTL